MFTSLSKIVSGSLALFALPFLASAQFQANGGQFGKLLETIIVFANNIIIPFILGLGFLFFVWGMFKYFIAGGDDEDKRAEGKNLIIYATAGFVIIFIFWGLISLIATSTGFNQQKLDNKLIPAAPTTR